MAWNPRVVTHHEVTKLLRMMQIETGAVVEGTALIEVVVKKPKLVGKAFKELDLPEDAIIGTVVRRDECLIPRGDTKLELNDRLLVFTRWDEIEKIEEIFE